MNAQQTAAVLGVIKMEWSHSPLGSGTTAEIVAYWHKVLGAYDYVDVEAAVKEIIASGRDHAPGAGYVAKMTAERLTDVPEWDEAWREVLALVSRYGRYAGPGGQPGSPGPERFSHPTIAAFAIPAWEELCAGPAAGTSAFGTHHAQQREAYKSMRGRTQRDVALAAIGAPRRRGELGPAGSIFSDFAGRLTSG